MANTKNLLIKSLLFSQPLKPLFFTSFSLGINTCHSTKEKISYLSVKNIESRALYFLNSCRTSERVFQIHAQLITSGLFQNPSFSGRLLKLSSELTEDPCYTYLMFKCIDSPDAFCVNTVIKNYSCSQYCIKAVAFYIEMLKDCNFSPNSFTFPQLMSVCAKLSCLSLGRMCHGHVLKFGVDNVLPVQNSLIHFYACSGMMDVAWELFDEMLTRDIVSWNTVVGGYAKSGDMILAHKLFDVMPEKNVVTWNILMTGYLNYRNPGNVLKLFREMKVQGFESNQMTLVNVITSCRRCNRLKEGKSVHGFLLKAFSSLSLIIDTALVDLYSKCERLDVARAVFDRMPSKNLVSWNTMILGHSIHGNPIDGLNLYSEMLHQIQKKDDLAVKLNENSNAEEKNHDLPDQITFIGVLCACARRGMLTEAKEYFSQMTDVFQVKPNFAHFLCLANLMASIGMKQEAIDILQNIPQDEDVSPESSLWAGLFASCRFKGDVILSEQIAKDLIEKDPHNFSYYNLLVNIYAAAGKWEEVAMTKYKMKERGIRRVPCFSLKDLTDIVSNVNVGWYKLEKFI